jgi:hypothetical protein
MMFLPPSAFKSIPETAAECMPNFVMKQEIYRQGRSLQQPSLQVRRHPRLASQHRFQPQGRGVTGH